MVSDLQFADDMILHLEGDINTLVRVSLFLSFYQAIYSLKAISA